MARTFYYRYDKDKSVRLFTPFHADFVTALKEAVPSSDRAWYADERYWWVSNEYAEIAIATAKIYFGTARGGPTYGEPGWQSTEERMRDQAKQQTDEAFREFWQKRQSNGNEYRGYSYGHDAYRQAYGEWTGYQRKQANPPPARNGTMTTAVAYQTLQVVVGAEPEVIKAAYRALMLKYHPDRNKSPDAEEQTKRLNAAYELVGQNGH